MSANELGYAVAEWNQASGQPSILDGTFTTDIEEARYLADAERERMAKFGRNERYTVVKVVALEEDDD